MNLKLKTLTLLVPLLLCSVASAQTPAERKDRDLKFEPFTIPVEGVNVVGELGRLTVRENRSNPKSNLIELAFVRLKSTAEKPGYPVVYLDGGPGSSAINIARVPDYMRAFTKLREVGDVILLDQRGVGRSKPNLTRLAAEPLPLDVFADSDVALRAYRERAAAQQPISAVRVSTSRPTTRWRARMTSTICVRR